MSTAMPATAVSGGSRLRHRWRARLGPLARARPVTLVRWASAVVLLVLSAVLAVHPAATAGEPIAPTLVAARDLPLGASLGPDDLRIVEFPVPLRPRGAFDSPAQALGRPLAGAVRAGEPITDARLIGARPNVPGTATVPVRLADPGVAGLLHAGTKVSVVTAGAGHPAQLLTEDTATVLTVLPPSGGGQNSPRSGPDGPLVLLSVPLESATALASASLGQAVTVTLR